MVGFACTDPGSQNTRTEAVSARRQGHDERPALGLPSIDEPGERTEDGTHGGDPACWAHLVCPECGAVESDGHRSGCQFEGHRR